MRRVEKSADGSIASAIAMNDLDLSCGGLLPLIAPLEGSPTVYDDRTSSWLTREELRTASLDLAKNIASEQKRLAFLLCGVNSETIIGLLAAAAAGHATALIDPSVPEDSAERSDPGVSARTRSGGAWRLVRNLRDVGNAKAAVGSVRSRAGVVEWIARDERVVVSADRPRLAAASVHIWDNRQPEICAAVA